MNTKSRPNISSPSALDNRDLDGGPAGNFENGNQASATAALQDAGGPSPSLIESINQAEQGKLEGDLFPWKMLTLTVAELRRNERQNSQIKRPTVGN